MHFSYHNNRRNRTYHNHIDSLEVQLLDAFHFPLSKQHPT